MACFPTCQCMQQDAEKICMCTGTAKSSRRIPTISKSAGSYARAAAAQRQQIQVRNLHPKCTLLMQIYAPLMPVQAVHVDCLSNRKLIDVPRRLDILHSSSTHHRAALILDCTVLSTAAFPHYCHIEERSQWQHCCVRGCTRQLNH